MSLSANKVEPEVFCLSEEVFEASGLFLGSGFEGDGLVVGTLGFDHGVEDAGEFVGGGRDAFGFSKAGFHFAAEVPEFGVAAPESLGAQAQDCGNFVGDFAGGGFEDFAAADAVVWTESEPRAEALGRWKGFEDLGSGSQFANEGGKGGCRDAVDAGKVDSVKAQGLLENQIAGVGFVAAQGLGGLEVLGRRRKGRGDGLEMGLDFEIEFGDLLQEAPVGLVALAQDEEVFGAVVAPEGFDDIGLGGAATRVAEGGEGCGVAFALEDGVDDGHAAEAVEVAEHMVEMEVHFGEGLLHELDLARGVGDEVGPVAQQGAQCDDVVGGAETFAKETGGVELL